MYNNFNGLLCTTFFLSCVLTELSRPPCKYHYSHLTNEELGFEQIGTIVLASILGI